VLLALIPLAFLVVLIWRCYVDVPYWDEWALVPQLQNLRTGTFKFLDLWQQHNEHRPLFGFALVLTIVSATHWNTAAELAANVLVGVMILGVFAHQVISQWPAGYRLPLWLLPLLSLVALSANQWESWLWGIAITIMLNALAVVTGLALLTRLEGRWTRLAGALACGIVATYTFASGLVFWVSGAGAWWFQRGQRKPAQIVVWVVVALLTIASYFYDYHPNPGHPTVQSNFASLYAFGLYLAYFAKYTGAAVATYDGRLAALAGLVGLALFVWLGIGNRHLAGRPVFAFTLLAGLHSTLVALMTGLGRTGLGTDQGLSSRYVTLSTPLWFAIFVLAALRLSWLQTERLRSDRSATDVWSIRETGLISAAMVAIVASALVSGLWGTIKSDRRRQRLEPARLALITGQDDEMLLRLYPSVADVRKWREVLIASHLSVFRDARAQMTGSRSH